MSDRSRSSDLGYEEDEENRLRGKKDFGAMTKMNVPVTKRRNLRYRKGKGRRGKALETNRFLTRRPVAPRREQHPNWFQREFHHRRTRSRSSKIENGGKTGREEFFFLPFFSVATQIVTPSR